ncbi:MAG: hypothetical protein IPL92_17530 [Saprospiraceae bacterium]|nr:hypothetical protein [Candidatus Opimibacter iunctus]
MRMIGSRPVGIGICQYLIWWPSGRFIICISQVDPPDSGEIVRKGMPCGDEVLHTLAAWMFVDYVVHLEHHLREMADYD